MSSIAAQQRPRHASTPLAPRSRSRSRWPAAACGPRWASCKSSTASCTTPSSSTRRSRRCRAWGTCTTRERSLSTGQTTSFRGWCPVSAVEGVARNKHGCYLRHLSSLVDSVGVSCRVSCQRSSPSPAHPRPHLPAPCPAPAAALRDALGMPNDSAPPPWLRNMQRYGPPPSYPELKIPGLNAPIPPGAMVSLARANTAGMAQSRTRTS